jgi:hypothetical protein
MQALDFQNSFLTFRIDTEKKMPATVSHPPPFSLNNARIQLECRLTVSDRCGDLVDTFVLGASCKTERVGVDRDIWTEPNADFVPIFSGNHFLNLKTYARAGMEVDRFPPAETRQPERQSGRIADTFDSVRIEPCERPAELLSMPEEIVAATLAGDPLVARTTISSEEWTAVAEYPLKTMNANERDDIYQCDTGPVLFPDPGIADADALLPELQLAYVAFNGPDWSEWIVRAPVSIGPGITVYHYHRCVRVEGANEVLRLAGD